MIRGRAHARTVVALLLFLTVLTLRFRTGVSAAISPSSSMLSLDQTDYYHSFLQFVEHVRATDVRIVDHCCRLLTYVLIKCCALACSPPPRCCYLYKQQSTGGYSTRNPIQHLFSADELLPLLHPHTLCNMVTIAPILMSIMKKYRKFNMRAVLYKQLAPLTLAAPALSTVEERLLLKPLLSRDLWPIAAAFAPQQATVMRHQRSLQPLCMRVRTQRNFRHKSGAMHAQKTTPNPKLSLQTLCDPTLEQVSVDLTLSLLRSY